MRSATALRACIRQLQPRAAAAARQIGSRRLAATAASVPREKSKEPASARDLSSLAASAEGQHEHEHENDTSSRYPPAQHSYFNFKLSKPLAASLALVLGGTAVGIWFPPDLQVAYHPPAVAHALSAPVRRGSGEQSSARLEKALATLPPVLALRHAAFELGEGDLWREMRHNPIHGPSGTIGNTNMLASALFGPEKIAIPPFLRERRDGRESVLIVHVGNNLCGHDGIVHGGLVATLFDQYLYRHGVQNLDAGIAATAHLSVNYRAPVRANQFLVMKSTREEDSRKPHKVIIQGRLEDINGNLLAEAKGVFVTPKDAKNFFKPTTGSAAPPQA